MSEKKLYRTFVAASLTVEEMMRFLLDWSALESTSWTTTCITWNETSPRLCTIAIHVEAEQDYMLCESFKRGMLHNDGWDKLFVLMPEMTTTEEFATEFKEPILPGEDTRTAVLARVLKHD